LPSVYFVSYYANKREKKKGKAYKNILKDLITNFLASTQQLTFYMGKMLSLSLSLYLLPKKEIINFY